MFTGPEFVDAITRMGITHVVWVPDSVIGGWESDLESADLQLIRVCREGEAWALAAGLLVGGKQPLLVMQTTGLFESGDALRNVIYDLSLPLFAVIGARNWLAKESADSARRFALPILNAWEVDYMILESADQLPDLVDHYRACQAADKAGVALLAE